VCGKLNWFVLEAEKDKIDIPDSLFSDGRLYLVEDDDIQLNLSLTKVGMREGVNFQWTFDGGTYLAYTISPKYSAQGIAEVQYEGITEEGPFQEKDRNFFISFHCKQTGEVNITLKFSLLTNTQRTDTISINGTRDCNCSMDPCMEPTDATESDNSNTTFYGVGVHIVVAVLTCCLATSNI
jgi:hypothetical protein